MTRRLTLVVFALLWEASARAAIVSDKPAKVTLTIYQDEVVATADLASPAYGYTGRQNGTAYVRETRTIDFPAGRNVIEFRGVMSTIVPQSAEISGLPGGVLEQNFDYNLLSPASLLAKSIGQTVHLVRADPKTGKLIEQTAIVRSAPSGTMLEIDGKLEALHCSGLPEKLVFENVPAGLRDKPTLSVHAMMPKAGRYTITLGYIATGLYWSADYNARIRPDGRSIDLSGWITLANFSDTSFKQIPVEVVAGHLFTTGNDKPVSSYGPRSTTECWETNINWATRGARFSPLYMRLHGGIPQQGMYSSSPVTAVSQQEMKIDPRELADYKLYPLPELTDVASHQTKQIQFLHQSGVSFEQIYGYVIDPDVHPSGDVAAISVLRLHNTQAAGLGKPLPAGTISVTEQAPDGSSVLTGQDSVYDTSTGMPLEIATGRAIDVRVKPRETSVQSLIRGKDRLTRTTYEIVVENDKSIPIRFELAQPVSEDTRVVAEDQSHAVEPNGMFWSFALSPGERKTMHYTIEAPES